MNSYIKKVKAYLSIKSVLSKEQQDELIKILIHILGNCHLVL